MANGLPKRWEMEARVIINSTKHTDVALISISRRPLLSLDNSNALLNPEDHTGYITFHHQQESNTSLRQRP
jgi:hypothetical protein